TLDIPATGRDPRHQGRGRGRPDGCPGAHQSTRRDRGCGRQAGVAGFRARQGGQRMGPRVMRRLPKFVHGYLDRHGRARHYLRRPGRKVVPLPGLPWSTEFMDAYEAAMANAVSVIIGEARSAPGTIAEAVARYLGSAVFTGLAPSTQAMR